MSIEIAVPGASPPAEDRTADIVSDRAVERAQSAQHQAVAAVVQGRQAAEQVRAAIDDANVTAIENALTAADLEADALQQRLAEMTAAADFRGAARAQRELIQLAIRRGTLQDGLDELRPPQPEPARITEGAVRAPVQQQSQPQPAAQGGTFEEQIARMPLLPSERNWLREHPDAISPQKQQVLATAYRLAEARGIVRGSQDYFDFFNEQLGYQGDGRHQQRPASEYQPAREHRAAPSGQPKLKPGQIMLTAEQREAARISGLSEYEYALNLKRLEAAKRQGMYPN